MNATEIEARLNELLEQARARPGVAELMELYSERQVSVDVSDLYLGRVRVRPVFTVSSSTQ